MRIRHISIIRVISTIRIFVLSFLLAFFLFFLLLKNFFCDIHHHPAAIRAARKTRRMAHMLYSTVRTYSKPRSLKPVVGTPVSRMRSCVSHSYNHNFYSNIIFLYCKLFSSTDFRIKKSSCGKRMDHIYLSLCNEQRCHIPYVVQIHIMEISLRTGPSSCHARPWQE